MSYRTITVDGKVYEYAVGQTHTKVKGVVIARNESFAPKVEIHQYCECCGESMTDLYGKDRCPPDMKVAVTPQHVAALIRTHQ